MAVQTNVRLVVLDAQVVLEDALLNVEVAPVAPDVAEAVAQENVLAVAIQIVLVAVNLVVIPHAIPIASRQQLVRFNYIIKGLIEILHLNKPFYCF